MTRYYQHVLFRQAVRRDREAAKLDLQAALNRHDGVATQAAAEMRLQPWFFRQWMRILGLGPDINPVERPSRAGILLSLIRNRGDHLAAAAELGTTRSWMARAISDYNLRREAPDSHSAFWRNYE